MKQFYETYKDSQILSALLRELSWTNNLLVMSRAKTDEERLFYIRLAIDEKYSSRELERQFDAMRFERAAIAEKKSKNLPINQEIKERFLDSYVYIPASKGSSANLSNCTFYLCSGLVVFIVQNYTS
jgi:predicted nuclease of restriction endonuclease-like (RecB) superfamily